MTQQDLEAAQAAMPTNELIAIVEAQISSLAKTGGRSFTMSVPPKPTDTDMALSELVKRFKAITEII